MKRRLFIIGGLIGLFLGASNEAGAVIFPGSINLIDQIRDGNIVINPALGERLRDIVIQRPSVEQRIRRICEEERSTSGTVGGPKCETYRRSCETIIIDRVQDSIPGECTEEVEFELSCLAQFVEGGDPTRCRLVTECEDRFIDEAHADYVEQLEKECPPIQPDDPPADPADPEIPPADPVDPETPPVDPVDPEEPIVQPEPPTPPVAEQPLQEETGKEQTAPRPTLQLRGGGCALVGIQGGGFNWLDLAALFLPVLGSRKRNP